MVAQLDIRPSPIVGRWYESDSKRLARNIDGFMEPANLPPIQGEIIGLVVPHAGHRYSGRTAGTAFGCIRGNSYELVIVVSPYHDLFTGSLITTAHQAYETPLGVIPVDVESLSMLDSEVTARLGTNLNTISRDSEHSLEIELPFLQRALPGDFQLLPLMVRSRNWDKMREVGGAIAKIAARKKTLLVASSDLSHFYPEPEAKMLDAFMLGQIEALSPEGVLEADRRGKGFACGAGAVSAVLWAALELGANKGILLHYSHSGEETGDRRSVVGYGSAALVKVD